MLRNSRILLTRTEELDGIKSVFIHNSTFGELIVGAGYEVLITHSVFVGNKSGHSTVKIEITNGSLKIEECKFNGVKVFNNVSILKTVNSYVYITNSSFEQCNAVNSSLIFLKNSFLELQSTFAYNHGTCVQSQENSTVTISHSDFISNKGLLGSSLEFKTSHSISVYGSTFINNTYPTGGAICCEVPPDYNQILMVSLIIHNSIFTGNTARIGGAIYVKGLIESTSINNTFIHNRADRRWLPGPHCGGAIYAYNGILNIMMSSFITNYAFYGGAVYINNTLSYHVTKCRFENNSASRGGAFKVARSRIKVMKSKFRDNMAVFGGALWLGKVSISTQDLIFQNNTAIKGAAAYCVHLNLTSMNDMFYQNNAIRFRSYEGSKAKGGAVELISGNATYQHAVITNNTAEDYGGAIYLQKGSALTLNSCTLISNFGINDGYIYVQLFSSISIINGTLNENIGAIAIEVHSTLFVENTKFANNINHPFGYFSVMGRSYSKISVNNSTFINEELGYNGLLSGKLKTDIVLMNSLFKSPRCKRISRSVDLSEGSKMSISNCIISHGDIDQEKCMIFYIFGSVLFINDTIISNYTWRNIVFLRDSHLYITNSTLSNNRYKSSWEGYGIMAIASHVTLLNLSIFDSEFNSHVIVSESKSQITNCNFQNNRGGTLLKIYGRSKFTIMKSEFKGNRGIIKSTNSTFVFDGCHIQNNTGHVIRGDFSNGTLKHCLLTNNKDNSTMDLIYMGSNKSNYLDMRNTTFDANILKPERVLINIFNVADVRIQGCNFTQTNGNHSGIINFTDGHIIRIANSKLKATSSDNYFISFNITKSTTVELLTSKSEFVCGTEHMFTDKETFLSEVYKSGILRTDSEEYIKNFETNYASGKY